MGNKFSTNRPKVEGYTKKEVDNMLETVHIYPGELDKTTLEWLDKIKKLSDGGDNYVLDKITGPLFLLMLTDWLQDPNEKIRFEAVSVLINITKGTRKHIDEVKKTQAVPRLFRILTSQNLKLREQAAWVLANINGDGNNVCTSCVDLDIVKKLLEFSQSNIVFLKLTRRVAWILHVLSRDSESPKEEHFEVVFPFLVKLLENSDDEVLYDTCRAISYFETGNNKNIQMVIDSGITPRLIQLLSFESDKVHEGALRAIGDIASGNDEQRQFVVDSGVLELIPNFLKEKNDFSNVAAIALVFFISGGTEQQKQTIIDLKLMDQVIEMFKFEDSYFEVKFEVAWAIENLADEANSSQLLYLVKSNAIPTMCPFLSAEKPKEKCNAIKVNQIKQSILQTIYLILTNLPDKQSEVYEMIKNCGQLNTVKKLRKHKSEEISTLAKKVWPILFKNTVPK